ncbi:ABC transporter substrate-binding protein [Haloplanus ruber]|uniref:PotD/PotF family extracellular solute-binding protein n=1 Tax=Haloplanus ruber TaxID=869892 RepID=A0ABD6CZ49_9EURY|nr:PotD/PotF family extracellular solute-binding protein [Haloplanus ruber]
MTNSRRNTGEGDASNRSGRRAFLVAAGSVGAAGLAGCAGRRDVGGSDGGDGGESSGDGGEGGSTGTTTGNASGDGNTLNILTWEGYGTDQIVSEFESEHDATVNIKLLSSDPEGFNTLQSGGTDTFDLLTLNNTWAQRHAQAGTIEPLDPADYPERENFLERFQEPFSSFRHDGEMYALPTRWGWDTLTVNTDQVPEEHYQSYETLWTGGPNGEYEGKIGIMDWPTWNIPKIALSLGYPAFEQTESQIEDIRSKLVDMFSNMNAVYSGTSAIRQAFLQEDIVMAPVGNFAMSQLRAEGNDWVNVVIPEQGGMQWTEGLCIVKNPSNRELAVEFQRKIISAQGQYNVSWKPSAKSPPVNTDSFDMFDDSQQQALMFNEEGFDAAAEISQNTTPYEFSPITDTWTDLWTEAKARAGI